MRRHLTFGAVLFACSASLVHAQPCEVATFDAMPLGATFSPGAVFPTMPGVNVSVGDFVFTPGPCAGPVTSGFTRVENGLFACRSGFELNVNNVTLKFDFGAPVACVDIHYGEYGGTVSLDVNGDCRVVNDFPMLPPALGGVNVNVVPITADCGIIRLEGVVNSVVIGGQELYIDDIRFCRGCRLNCPAGDGSIVTFASAGNKSPDLNSDGIVNIVDFTLFAAAFLTPAYCADFDCNGVVDLPDFTRFAAHFLHSGVLGECCR